MSISISMRTEHAAGSRPSSLRIALLGLGRYAGGGPISLQLARALSRDHTVRCFVDSGSLVLNEWRASGLDVHVHDGVYRRPAEALLGLVWSASRRRLVQAIRRFAPDVLLVPFIHLWARGVALDARVPMVLCVHDPSPHPGLTGRVWHVVERRAVRSSAHLVLHSEAFVGELVRRYGVPRESITVAPLGPMSNYLDAPLPVQRGGPPVVLCFGRIEPYKGIDVLLDAVPAIRAAVPAVRFRIAGSGAPGAQVARARSLGIEFDDRWVGDDEVPAMFGEAAIVVLPYVSATQSGVIPIAAAFGRAVVATDVGGLAEQVDGGRLGLLVHPGDSAALARAVVSLLEDSERAAELGRRLREHYDGERSWARAAEAVGRACLMASASRPRR